MHSFSSWIGLLVSLAFSACNSGPASFTTDTQAPASPAPVSSAPSGQQTAVTTPPPTTASIPSGVDVLTDRYTDSRAGANNSETVLNTSNVNTAGFGQLFSRSLDGSTYAQPLIVTGYTLPGGKTADLLISATMHNSVYAFDASDASVTAPYWQVNLGPSVPTSNFASYYDISTEIGILSTPVIDRVNGVIYVVAETYESGSYIHRLHALNLGTGAELAGSPVVIGGSVAGTGEGSVNGVIAFNSQMQLQRPSILLTGGQLVLGFGSHGDTQPYHGWVMTYDAKTLAQTSILNLSPESGGAGLWQAGSGLTSDDQGNVFGVTGNGFGSDPTISSERTESVIRLSLSSSGVTLADWFTPSDWQTLDANDTDVGCDGAMLLPGTHLLITGSKSGTIYLLDQSNLGHLVAGDAQIPEEFQAIFSPSGQTEHIHGTPVFWQGPDGARIYVWGENDYGRAYAFNGSVFGTQAADQTLVQATQGSMPGGILSVSSNGSQADTGIVWANLVISGNANHAVQPGILRAFDASNLSNELWNSQQNASRDSFGLFAKYVPPVVANGKVYMATFSNQVVVYGLL